jgi:hypothetical protein
MEYEVMLFCNFLGVLILFLIAMMHIGGDDREKNAEVLNFGAKKEL